MVPTLWLLSVFGPLVAAAVVLRTANHSLHSAPAANRSDYTRQPLPTFPSYVESIMQGRGIWKWNNALEAYERHLAWFKWKAVKLGEVGVWSGGSLLMWHAVLGPFATVYGMDISQDALKFDDRPKTIITLLDQGDVAQWRSFFSAVTANLDVLIDDGGHTSPLMLATASSAWPQITDGGILAIEDIHGAHYLEEFFVPVAHYYGGQGRATLAALHIYPFLLIAEKTSTQRAPFLPTSTMQPITVASLMELPVALGSAPPGSHVIVENATWGDFLAAATTSEIFRWFVGLHAPKAMFDVPQGCALTNAAACVSGIRNSGQQDRILGIHIYPSKLLIEVTVAPPLIQAVRHGSEWAKYPTHS